MILRLLQEVVKEFGEHLRQADDFPSLYIWESQRIFQEEWDLDAEDLSAMYDCCLQNPVNRRLWKDERYRPKELMLLFAAAYPDFVREMFKDLFNENREVDGRMDRFIFHCDELVREYRDTNEAFIETSHYHEDYRMVSLYLAFRYPDQYALYDHEAFRHFLQRVQGKPLSEVADPARYFKVMRTLYQLLSKEESLMAAHYARLDPQRHFMGHSLLLAMECCRFLTP